MFLKSNINTDKDTSPRTLSFSEDFMEKMLPCMVSIG